MRPPFSKTLIYEDYFDTKTEADDANHKIEEDTSSASPTSVQSVGTTYLLSQRAEVLGVTKLLASIFPDCYQSMLQIAFYMLNRGNVLLYMDDYFEMVESPHFMFI
ncbi:hypothetical protein [Tuanshanicoccus lijuaniae]|uniref:hypothetical protein n=1 Tax=Aerococcaceae bacterium zg-1292 TaxID=2774330 RepID=UPI001BD844F2|nr:hypothetical protein [Aerococcaceae bacterium zg-A91]MBS4457763.1 hypothetical protein [Aerococcaceae bacterium zg-BR33]